MAPGSTRHKRRNRTSLCDPFLWQMLFPAYRLIRLEPRWSEDSGTVATLASLYSTLPLS